MPENPLLVSDLKILEEEETATLVVAAQACPQGRERQLIHFPLMHKKYTLKLTKMQSGSIQAPSDEG